MKAKYIIIEDETGLECPIIFPDHLLHKGVAQALSPFKKPVSAGFVEIGERVELLDCYGYSSSLNLGPRDGDMKLIKKMLRYRSDVVQGDRGF